jgi:hypothetical protein
VRNHNAVSYEPQIARAEKASQIPPGRFASSSLWGKFGGLYACGATLPYTVPLPNIFLTHLFSKTRLKRKDFQEVGRLAWAQEVPSSNLGTPTTYFFVFNELFPIPQRWKFFGFDPPLI